MAEKLTIELIVDDKGSVVVKDFSAKTEKALGKIDASTKGVDKTTQGWMKSWNLLGVAAAAAAGVIAYKVIDMGAAAIDAASNLEEVSSKFNVVFASQEALAESWADTLVDAYAMSTREAKQYLSSVQDLLVPMGMAADKAGLMSNEVVTLSADLGSFNNLPTAQVMDDIQSALVGNYETMKKYGVVLNATTVQQKALEMGLAQTKDELTAADKAQAAYKLMVEGSTSAIGDMARTTGSHANQVKALKARLEDLQATIGERLLPTMTKLVEVTADVVDWMTILAGGKTALIKHAEATERLYQATLKYNKLMALSVKGQSHYKNTIIRVKEEIDAASLAMGRQAVFYKKVADAAVDGAEKQERAAKERLETEKANAEARRQILERFQDDFEKSTLSIYEYQVRTLNEQYAAYAEHIDDKVLLDQWYASEVRRLQQELGIFGFMGGDWAAAWSSIVATAQSVMGIAKATQKIIEMPVEIVDSVTSLLDSIGDFASNLVASLDNFIDGIFNMIVNLGDVFTELIPKLITLPYETVLSIVKAIPEFIRALVDSIPFVIDAFVKDVPRIILEIVESIPAIIESVIDAIPQIIDAFIDAIPDIIEAFIKSIPDIAEALGKAIVDVIEDAIPGIPGIGGGDWDWGDLWPTWTIPFFHKGGMIRAHQGLFLRPEERIVVAQTGEGILSRQDMAKIGGETGFNAIRRGGSAPFGGAQINLTINADVITTDDVDAWIAARLENLKEYRVGHQIARVDITTVGVDEKWPSS